MKKAYGFPDVLHLLDVRISERVPVEATSIAVNGYGGLPLGSAVSLIVNKRLILVRDEPKNHRSRRWIDGYIPNKDDKVVVIDDVYTTGGSLRRVGDIVRNTRAEIN